VTDPTSEALFIRDDDSGEIWSPTPGPCARDRAAAAGCVIRHSAGVTHFSRAHRGIAHTSATFVDAVDPVKFSVLTLVNTERSAAPAQLS
jgi:cyclic beta-1,2-glucan synthetase